MRLTALFALLAVLSLAACSPAGINGAQSDSFATAQAPLASGYPLSSQPKMQAMAHWDSLAATVAGNCAKALDHFHPDGELRVYVAPAQATPFGKSYREALLTRLVDYGVPVSFTPDGAAVLEVGVETVTHRRTLTRNRSGRLLIADPGFVQAKDEKGRYPEVPMVSEESGLFDPQTPQTEIQVTSALVHNGGYLYRDSSIFYVDGRDMAHYKLGAPTGDVELKRYSLVNK